VCGLARQQRLLSEDEKEEVKGRIARDASLFVIVTVVKVRQPCVVARTAKPGHHHKRIRGMIS
jgi:hypothetical protein